MFLETIRIAIEYLCAGIALRFSFIKNIKCATVVVMVHNCPVLKIDNSFVQIINYRFFSICISKNTKLAFIKI